MRIMVTGHDGYIGRALVPLLTDAGHETGGFDSMLYDGCAIEEDSAQIAAVTRADIRDAAPHHFQGYDAVVHLAGLSNDPLGDLAPDTTFDINHRGAVEVARAAKAAGVARFVFSSSCSLYGAHGDDYIDESAEFLPVTPYGESKVLAERDLNALADDTFHVTHLRNATAYGYTARIRGDLVVNNLVGYAVATGQVRLKSDGSSWRPLVHVEDIARAFVAMVDAPLDQVSGRAFNIGRTDENYLIRDVAHLVADIVPDSTVTLADGASPDIRNYRVNCDLVASTVPGFHPRWTVADGIAQVYEAYRRYELVLDDLVGPRLSRIAHIRGRIEDGTLEPSLRDTVTLPR